MAIRGTDIYNGVRALDAASLKIITSAEEFAEALHHDDMLSAIQSSLDHVKGLAELPDYLGITGDKATMAAAVISQYIPFSVDGVVQFFKTAPVIHALASLGIVVGSLEVMVNGIDLYKQTVVLGAIASNDSTFAKLLELEKLNFNTFKTSLPLHLKERLEKFGNEEAFTYFKEEVLAGRPGVAKHFVDDVENYLLKKRIVHSLAILAAICALAASIGMLIAFPPLVIILLSGLGIALTTVRFALNSGWVENPRDGFNWKLVFPEFLRKGRLATETSIEPEEMKLMGRLIDSKNLIETQPKFVSDMRDHDEEDEELFIDFRVPPEIPKEERPSFWDRLMIKFKIESTHDDVLAQQGILRFGFYGGNDFFPGSKEWP